MTDERIAQLRRVCVGEGQGERLVNECLDEIDRLRKHVQLEEADAEDMRVLSATTERQAIRIHELVDLVRRLQEDVKELATIREYLTELKVLHRSCESFVDNVIGHLDDKTVTGRKLREVATSLKKSLGVLGQR